MNETRPQLRSEVFNEAFENFENAFLKALAKPHSLVFETHDTVLQALRGMNDGNAITKLREAENSFKWHASGEKPLHAPKVEFHQRTSNVGTA